MNNHGGKREGAGRPETGSGKKMLIYIDKDHVPLCKRYSAEKKLSRMINYAIHLFKKDQGISGD